MDFRKIITLVFTSGFVLSAQAHIPNNDFETPLIGPTFRLSHTAFITNDMAYSLAGELGVRDLRGAATFGYQYCENQRAKITAEILSQKLTYHFYTGNEEEWISQGAVGFDYSYDWNYFYNSQFDLRVYASYANSKSLVTQSATLISHGIPELIINKRHIAGSYAFGVAPGWTLLPWEGTRVQLQLDYDGVNYNTDQKHHHTNPNGFGGTVQLNQLLTEGIGATTIVSVRSPFNYYYLDISLLDMTYMGRWNTGLYAEYVDGKKGLENSWNIGIRADYFLDPTVNMTAAIKGEVVGPSRPIDPFITWVADPAVRMPQVLAIADESVSFSCKQGLPRVIGTIPDDTSGIFIPTNYATAQVFAGANLTFTLASVRQSNPSDVTNVTINATTGIVTVTPVTHNQDIVTITVQATNKCGTASATFHVTIAGNT